MAADANHGGAGGSPAAGVALRFSMPHGWISNRTPSAQPNAELDALTSDAPSPMSAGDVLAIVERFGSMAAVLTKADQTDRALFYEALGVTATYDPATRSAELAVEIPRSAECVSEGGLDAQRYAVRLTRAVDLAA